MKNVDVLIFGSGFCASETNLHLDGGISRVLLDVSESFHVECAEQELFSSETMKRNAQVGGGILEWGGAISNLEDAGVFSTPENFKFNLSGRTLNFEPKNYFNKYVPPDALRIATARFIFNRLFRGMSNRFEFNVGGYSSPIRKGTGPRKEPDSFQKLNQVETAILKELRYLEDERLTVAKFQNSDGTAKELSAKRVVFASGALGNAFLVSKLTGQRDFPIGNHVSRISAEVHFKRTRYLGALVQEWRPRDKQFFTMSLSDSDNLGSGLAQASIRWFANDDPSNQEPSKNSLLNRVAKRLRFYSRATIQEMQVLEPGAAKLRFNETGCSAHIEVAPGTADTLKRISRQLFQATERGLGRRGVVSPPNEAFNDAAHYFGTVPMSDSENNYLGVDCDFALKGFPTVYCAGLSAMPKISHAHPTIFALASGMKVAEKIGLDLGPREKK